MKSLSKDKVLRWVSGTQPQGGSGGGGGSVDVSGYATQIWTEQNYLSKEFFSSLFKAYDANGNEVLPNDTETVIDNIKAMFGFWTEQYVSALGQGTGGGGGGGASALSDLLDVEINNPTNGQSLVYNSALSKWVNAAGSGVDMETVWRYLAQSSTQQIDISHLTTALNGYATQTWANGQFLKLSGGTMTGSITMKANQYTGNYAINMNNSDIVNANSIYTSDLSDSWDEGIEFKRTNGYYDSFRAADGTFYFGVNSGTEKDGANLGSASANLGYVYTNQIHPGNNNNLWLNTSTNMHIIANGPLIIPISNDVALSSYGRYALAIGGDPRNNEAHIGIDNNEIMAKGSASITATLYLNAEGGTVCINETAGNCGIGTGSPSYKLHVAGTIYATGNVTALSDARHKTIISDAAISVEQIAKMPAVVYQWNDGREDNGMHVGSIAQDWQRILPEVVMKANDEEGTLSMQYGVAALVSSIITARKVVDHERRIAELERENKELKMKLKIA